MLKQRFLFWGVEGFKTGVLCVALAVLYSLCRPGWIELTEIDSPASASQVLGLQACATSPSLTKRFFMVSDSDA